MAKGPRRAGQFCWTNMITPRPNEAMEFFGQILGWTYFEMPGIGYGARVDGIDVGGIFDSEAPQTPPGTKPHIGGLLLVDNVDSTCAKVVDLGGNARPPFDVGDQGRLAVCHDPNGAMFDVWEPKSFAGTEVDSTHHGAPTWFETLTTDVEVATQFYAQLFGWKPEVAPVIGFDYTTFSLDGEPVAGLMQIPNRMKELKPLWDTYYTVKNSEEAVATAVKLDGTVFVAPENIPGLGRFAGIESPQGVRFYIIQYVS